MKPPVQSTPFLAGLAWLVSRPWYSWFTRVGQAVDQIGSGTGLTDGDKGDITVSGGGATWTIDDGAVTLSKIQDISASSLLGRGDSGSGPPQVISLGDGLVMSGTTLSASINDAFTPETIQAGETFTVPARKQVLWSTPVVEDGDLIIDGFWVQVD